MKIPLELLTNKKYQSLITNRRDEIFLSFSFKSSYKFEPRLKMSSKPTSINDLLWLYFNAIPKNIGDLASITSIPLFKERLFALSEYISSHDNLITKVYEKELTIIPTRINTLEFHKLIDEEGVS